MKPVFVCLSLCFLTLSIPAFCEKPIVIDNQNDFIVARGDYIDYLEDPSGKLTIEQISSSDFSQKFTSGISETVQGTTNVQSVWWLRLTMIDETEDKQVLFELFDFRIDHFEIYFPVRSDFKIYKGGSKLRFHEREVPHKNFIYHLPPVRQIPVTFYIKIKADEPVSFIGALRTSDRLIGYATTEYFLLSLFYGIALSMVLYNLFLFFTLKDKAYFYYILYVSSIVVYTACQDGLGFEYLWPDYPVLNDYMGPVSVYLIVIFGLFYARYFLNTKTTIPWIDKGLMLLVIFRTLLFIAWIFYPPLGYFPWIDIIPFLFLYVSGIVSWMSGYATARFFVLAFTMFFFGFVIYTLQHFNIITPNPLTVYSLNMGVLSEMILLSLALADRIKMLLHEKEIVQQEIISKLQENDWLKDQLNKELERKVIERTREFDNFVYRSSHDIKGPLKSIIGLTSVGLKDVQDVVARKYFQHILKSSTRLDIAIDHLSKLMEIRDSEPLLTKIDFLTIVNDVRSRLEHHPEKKKIKIKVIYKPGKEFYSDHTLIFSIFYNLIENALKFKDSGKPESFLEINIKVRDTFAYVVLKDNGMGIDKVSQDKIFDMFYKVNPESPGPGLGLYMIKISMDKLNGTIRVDSEEGVGTTMKLAIKNFGAGNRYAQNYYFTLR